MKSPSVTDRKAKVPQAPEVERLPHWHSVMFWCLLQPNMRKSLGRRFRRQESSLRFWQNLDNVWSEPHRHSDTGPQCMGSMQ